jgi:AcrR family transcriptional regulator
MAPIRLTAGVIDVTNFNIMARQPDSALSERRGYHHGNLREVLLEAARRLIAERGPAGFTLSDAAKLAGVSPAAPYRHFADKDALVRAVAADIAHRYAAVLAQAAAEAPPDPLSQFRATGVAAVRFAVRHPAHFRVVYTPGLHDHRGDDDPTRQALTAAQAAGALAPIPVDALMLTAQCAIYGLSRLIVDGQLPGGAVTPAQADAMTRAVTDVLGLGFLPR